MRSRYHLLSLLTVTLLFPALELIPGTGLQRDSTALAQTSITQDRKTSETKRLPQPGIQQHQISQFQDMIPSWQQTPKSLEVAQKFAFSPFIVHEDSLTQPIPVLAQTGSASRTSEALELYQQGTQLLHAGRYQEALAIFEQALVICQEIGERQGEGAILNNIGKIYDSLGRRCCIKEGLGGAT